MSVKMYAALYSYLHSKKYKTKRYSTKYKTVKLSNILNVKDRKDLKDHYRSLRFLNK